MTIKQCGIIVLFFMTLFAGAAFVAEAATADFTQALAQGELVVPAKRDPTLWGDALCNDGTDYDFVFQRSPSNSPLWVIYLEGGEFCDDDAYPCSERSKNLTTALPGKDSGSAPLLPHDIFSQDAATNPTFYNANIAFSHYCTSDFWSGNSASLRPTAASSQGWFFTGRLDVQAMVGVLQNSYGLDDSNPATQVLFAGSSAGGVGVIANADELVKLLPNTAAGKRLRLVVDGGYFPEFTYPGFYAGVSTKSLPDTMKAGYDFWGSALNPLCEQAQIKAGDSPSRCFFGAPSYPYLADAPPTGLGLPYLVAEASVDSALFGTMNIHYRLRADQPAVANWRAMVLNSFDGLPWVFSNGTMPYHILLPSDGWLTGPSGGTTLRDLITDFWSGGTPQQDIYGEP